MSNNMINGIIEVPITSLTLAVWNYKTDDPKLMRKLESNIKKHGQVENLIVREMNDGPDIVYEVVNGNHRLKALTNLGYDNVVCYNLGKITDATAKRIAVETNETKFGTDSIKLAEVMRDIRDEYHLDDILETMPFSKGELENFEGMLEFDWDQFNTSGIDGFEDIEKEEDSDPVKAEIQNKIIMTCPHCNKSFEAAT